ncbi:hypothetical protein B296_00048508, partial [Ensete ventricosum]
VTNTEGRSEEEEEGGGVRRKKRGLWYGSSEEEGKREKGSGKGGFDEVRGWGTTMNKGKREEEEEEGMGRMGEREEGSRKGSCDEPEGKREEGSRKGSCDEPGGKREEKGVSNGEEDREILGGEDSLIRKVKGCFKQRVHHLEGAPSTKRWLARTLDTDVVWTTRRLFVLPKGWDMWLTCPEVVGPSWFEETDWLHCADLGPPWNRGPRYVISFSPVPKGVSPRGESRGATRGLSLSARRSRRFH